MFRDESDHVIEKAKKTKRKSSSSKKQDSETSSGTGSPVLGSGFEPSTSHPTSAPMPNFNTHTFVNHTIDNPPTDHDIKIEHLPKPEKSSPVYWNADTVDHAASESPAANGTPNGFDSPTASYQEKGIAFFNSQYVTADKGCFPNYDFIHDIWQPPASPQEDKALAITAGITAVGLAGLSKMTGSKETMERARHDYGIALSLTNAALQDPVEVTKDTTMLSVLLLGTYEFMSGATPQTIQLWQKHVDGAAAVAAVRGTAQFRTSAGVRMFLLLNHSVLLSCMQTGLPMPKPILELRQELEKLKILNKATLRIVGHLSETIQLRYDIKMGALTDKRAILSRLFQTEADFVTIVASIPAPMRFRIVHLDQPHATAFADSCHVYPGLTQVTLWNVIRTMRILVQQSIVDQLCAGVADPLDLNTDDKLNLCRALRMQRKLANAIISSVPQHFGVVNWLEAVAAGCPEAVEPETRAAGVAAADPSSTPKSSSSSEDSQIATIRLALPSFKDTSHTSQPGGHNAARFMMLATSSNMIVWPLHTVGTSVTCTPAMRTYAIDRLDAIYAETGFHQAHEVANMVKEPGFDTDRWMRIYAALGSFAAGDLPEIV